MADVAMPAEIVTWMRDRTWGHHHLQWHVERMWGVLPPATIAWATSQGWKRYPVQEGEEGNGLHFLAMHRVMMAQLTTAFPAHKALFDGWAQPPTDPADPQDPVPGAGQPMTDAMKAAIERLHSNVSSFDGEDEFGRFIETSLRPFPNEPTRRSTNQSAGIHNYLHNRFSDGASPINMGDPSVNIENRQFWRLHGWIDGRWSSYRTASGHRDDDPNYLKLLDQAASHMEPGHGHHRPMAEARARVRVPENVREQILKALADRV